MPAPQITAEDLARIKAKQAQNLTEKLKSGKPLTRPEMAQLEELREDGVDVPDVEMDYPEHTKSDKVMRETIRRKVGISERMAYDWIKKLRPHKSNTKGWHVPEMLAMVLERQQAAVTGPNSDLKREELQEKVLILKAKRQELYKDLIPMTDHLQEITQHASMIVQGLDEFESIASAEFPESPRMLEIAQQVSDRIKEIMFERVKGIEEDAEEN